MEPLSLEFNCAVQTISNQLFPCGFDIAEGPLPYGEPTLANLTGWLDAGNRMVVSGEYCDRTIYADKEINCAFRAWHDFHHWKLQAEFDEAGEQAVFQAQARDLRTLFGHSPGTDHMVLLLWAEVMGQVYYQQRWGEFPKDQRRFVEGYLAYRAGTLSPAPMAYAKQKEH